MAKVGSQSKEVPAQPYAWAYCPKICKTLKHSFGDLAELNGNGNSEENGNGNDNDNDSNSGIKDDVIDLRQDFCAECRGEWENRNEGTGWEVKTDSDANENK